MALESTFCVDDWRCKNLKCKFTHSIDLECDRLDPNCIDHNYIMGRGEFPNPLCPRRHKTDQKSFVTALSEVFFSYSNVFFSLVSEKEIKMMILKYTLESIVADLEVVNDCCKLYYSMSDEICRTFRLYPEVHECLREAQSKVALHCPYILCENERQNFASISAQSKKLFIALRFQDNSKKKSDD